ncbi:MAG: hypothetical protein HY290_06445 [Planctomycetia bacterium]|nr:hypothetical protein [Planctomycetia bacterium]
MNNAISAASSVSPPLNGAARRRLARPQVDGNGTAVRRPSRPSRNGGPEAPSASRLSESSRRARLLGTDGRRRDSLNIDYRQLEIHVDLSAGGERLLCGPLRSELTIDGRPVTPRSEWKSVCWQSDDDGDYLEIQLWLTDSLRIDRQVFLSRRNRFALLADAVVAPGANRVEHRLHLPVAAGTAIDFDAPSRECRVGPARVFPLWMPQDRVLSVAGDCRDSGGALELSYTVAGGGLYLPVLLDWYPRHRRAAVEWRSLTVTEPGRVISPAGAAGHRVRIGKEQFLIFRGLAASHEPRAVLGQHTRCETLIARFDSDGDLDPLITTDVE